MQMGECVYLLPKGISIGIRLYPGMIHFSSFVAAMLHCNFVVLSPAELWIRGHASLFSYPISRGSLICADWFCLTCTKTQLFTDFYLKKKSVSIFLNYKQFLQYSKKLLHLSEAMGGGRAFNTAANQSSSETLSLANPYLRPSLKGLFLPPWIIQLLVFLSLSCVLQDLTIILHNLSVCKEGRGGCLSFHPTKFWDIFFFFA